MIPYKNKSGNSGVEAYKIGPESITVRFSKGLVYLYNYTTPGKRYVEEMKALAEEGRGLSTFISRNVKEKFADCWQE
jgi:hypothetical protein